MPASVSFELWENRSANIIAEFATQDEALDFVRDTIRGGGVADVLSWSLHRSDAAEPLAYGKALISLMDKHMPV
jgi:hypothetical protein